MFRASNQSGADQPDVSPPIFVDTAYDATFDYAGLDRLVYPNTTQGRLQATMDTLLAPDVERTMMLVNSRDTGRRGGAGDIFTTATNTYDLGEVMAHEYGHSFGDLADEYPDGNTGTYTGTEPDEPNVSTFLGNKWAQWLGFLGPNGTVGAYEGARYWPMGIFRPEPDCKMRTTDAGVTIPFCSVCREHLIKRIHQDCTMIRGIQPGSSTSVRQYRLKTFRVFHRIPETNVRYEWQVDNGPWTPGGYEFHWYVGNASTGNHAVRARVTDITPWVRNDPQDDLRSTVLWTVNVLSSVADETDYEEFVPAETATNEANNSTNYPFRRGDEMRVQYAYGRDAIQPDHPVKIVGVEFRPNYAANISAIPAVTYNFALDLSTSRNDPQSLSTTFESNHGADRARVFDGALSVPAQFLGSGSPRPNTIVVPFVRPFAWDPRSGPLLLDFAHRGIISGSASISYDCVSGHQHAGRVYSLDPAAATGQLQPGVALVCCLILDCGTAPLQVATTEGSTGSNFPFTLPAGSGMRSMYVYDSGVHQLDGLHLLTRLAWRTDQGGAFDGLRAYDMRVTLSTGVPDLSTRLSPAFDANHGPDKTVVFDGIWQPGASPSGTAPSAFLQQLELQTPFAFSHHRGSLVVDIQLRSATGFNSSSFDAERGSGMGRVYSLSGPDAVTGSTQDIALALCPSAVPQPVLPEQADGSPGTVATDDPWNLPNPSRSMNVYGVGTLGILEPINITHLSWRPAPNSAELGPVVYYARIELSTASMLPSRVSARFDDNHGADRTLVYSGYITVPYRRSSGSPADWAITVKLDQPFRWSLFEGPLVVDIRSGGPVHGGNTLPFDAVSIPNHVARVVHTTNPDAIVGNRPVEDVALALKLGGVGCSALIEPYGSGCPGQNGVPVASSVGLPWTGNREFSFSMHGGAPNQFALLLVGTAAQQLDLGPYGLPGCELLVNPDMATVGVVTDPLGDSLVPLQIPALPGLAGFTAYYQWLCLDPGAAGGAIASPGARFVICH